MDGVFCAFIVTYNKMVVNGFIFQNAKKEARMVIFFVLFTLCTHYARVCARIFWKLLHFLEGNKQDARQTCSLLLTKKAQFVKKPFPFLFFCGMIYA